MATCKASSTRCRAEVTPGNRIGGVVENRPRPFLKILIYMKRFWITAALAVGGLTALALNLCAQQISVPVNRVTGGQTYSNLVWFVEGILEKTAARIYWTNGVAPLPTLSAGQGALGVLESWRNAINPEFRGNLFCGPGLFDDHHGSHDFTHSMNLSGSGSNRTFWIGEGGGSAWHLVRDITIQNMATISNSFNIVPATGTFTNIELRNLLVDGRLDQDQTHAQIDFNVEGALDDFADIRVYDSHFLGSRLNAHVVMTVAGKSCFLYFSNSVFRYAGQRNAATKDAINIKLVGTNIWATFDRCTFQTWDGTNLNCSIWADGANVKIINCDFQHATNSLKGNPAVLAQSVILTNRAKAWFIDQTGNATNYVSGALSRVTNPGGTNVFHSISTARNIDMLFPWLP